jgi:universal stress protein A
MSYSGDLVLPDDFDLEQELLEIAKKQMEVLGNRLGIESADRHIEIGGTGHTILRLASALGTDLIVLGSHGRHGLSVLLGSTARTVLNGAGCDVLAVRIGE